ncbi:unnamed protein product [Acanthoscelides obtectus]|uniref:Uncharacterized protein n=1 Tax=Acanthoscelides obtectus TaxID=200917 RepID=A0A9P0KP05_ACAOB|nr:unnamed protein product [Acanthoscelides obtectus]CAK1635579.1 hypothetical protein AOBTE_LOCUS9366 [Acanthoscelides obtectus]
MQVCVKQFLKPLQRLAKLTSLRCGFPDFAISNEICKTPANHHHFFVTSKRTFCPV